MEATLTKCKGTAKDIKRGSGLVEKRKGLSERGKGDKKV